MSRVTRPVRARQPDLLKVRELVGKAESGFRVRVLALIVAGAPLSLFGPLWVAVIVWVMGWRQGRMWEFWPTFWATALVTLPIFFLLAAAIKGSILEGSAESFDSSTIGGRMVARQVAGPMVILEIANIGPRMVLYGFKRRKERAAIGAVDLERAAQAISTLANFDSGIPPQQLVLKGESVAQLMPVLRLLAFHDMAGMSKVGDRVWLSSDFRKTIGLGD